jgi:ABC-type Mn2+/Zn2+ transport system permease subunit
VYAGLTLSFHLDLAGSATIALVAVVEFFVVVLIRDARRALAARRAPMTA